MKITYKKIFLTLGISIALGFTLPFANVIWFLLLFFMLLIIGAISIVIILIGLFTDKELASYGILGLLSLIIFLIVGFSLTGIILSHKDEVVHIIMLDIEKYKDDNKHYPNSLSEIGKEKEMQELLYYSYDSLQEYRITYYKDGFNKKYYDSKTKEWGTLGWND